MSEVLHQYVVTYYSSDTHTHACVWRDILTDEITRHDGPCVYYLLTDKLFSYHDEDLSIDFSKELSEYMHRHAFVSTHQYTVTYALLDAKAIKITWRDILTNKLDRHDGGPTCYYSNWSYVITYHDHTDDGVRFVYKQIHANSREEYISLIEPKFI